MIRSDTKAAEIETKTVCETALTRGGVKEAEKKLFTDGSSISGREADVAGVGAQSGQEDTSDTRDDQGTVVHHEGISAPPIRDDT